MNYFRDLVKDMDDTEKLELMSVLIESIKPIKTTPLVDVPTDEDFVDMPKELYTPEEAYQMTMKDIKTIFDDATV